MSTEREMDPQERLIILHMLGLRPYFYGDGRPGRRWSYRNHYCSPSPPDSLMMGMSNVGWIRQYAAKCGYVWFEVTRLGVEVAGLERYVKREDVP